MAYGPGDYLIRVELGATTGLPRDKIVNDFAFRTVDEAIPSSGDIDALMTDVAAFYTVIATGAVAEVGKFLSPQISRTAGACRLVAYKIVVGSLGAPEDVNFFTMPGTYGGVTNGLPAEVAVVNSIHGDLTGVDEGPVGGIKPRARRRGRQYIGPLLSSGDVIDYATAPPRVKSTFREILAAASQQLLADALADDWIWSVWSRTLVDLIPVTGGFVDNDFDTIRGRQQRSTARTTWSA